MIKKIIFLAVISLVIATFGVAMAQDATDTASQTTAQEETITAQDLGVNEPTLLPDSKFYFLKNWKNAIQSVFTFGQEKKAELNLKIASTKLLEAEKLAEKTSNPQILEKATTLYNKQVEKINKNIDKFKGTATSSEAINKFLDKYTKQQILHTQILDKLEGKVPSSTMEKIKENREKHLEKFGQVMQKLEDKTKIQERLQTALDSLKNSALKEVKNVKILKEIKDKFPTSTQQQVQQAIDKGLLQLKEKLQLMPLKNQEKVSNYLEKIQGTIEKKMDIINDVKNSLPSNSTLKQKVEALKEKLQNNPTIQQKYDDCVCTMEVNPVCGADGKTYGNPCKAKCLNIAIVSQGTCGAKATTNQNVVGSDKDEHGCIGSAGYSWCEAKQKCLRSWEETCESSGMGL